MSVVTKEMIDALYQQPPWPQAPSYWHSVVWVPAICQRCARQFWFQLQRDRQPAPCKCAECEP